MTTAFIALGSNLGNRRKFIQSALDQINFLPNTHVVRASRLYETIPVGGPPQRDFLNAVIKISTSVPPKKLLSCLMKIEKSLGRKRTVQWGPRTIDLDLLSYGQLHRRSKNLTLPHPRYHNREFVLIPFCEIAPGFIHPKLRKTNRTLLKLSYGKNNRSNIVKKESA